MVSPRCLAFLALPLAVAAAPAAGEEGSASPVVGGALFVAGKFGNTLSKVDLASGETAITVDSCANPHELATSPDDAHVALACYGGQTLDIFRTADLAKIASIDLGANARPHGIVWHGNGDLYASAEGRQSIFRIRDPLGSATIAEHRSGQKGTHMLAVAPDGLRAWTTNLGSRTVSLIDLTGESEPRSVEVGEEPEGIWLSADGEVLWVSARGSNAAFMLDPATLDMRQRIETGNFPLRITLRPQGDFAVTSDLADGGLSVIDTAAGEVVRAIAVSSPEEAAAMTQVTILFSPDGARLYVAETTANSIAEVDFASGRVLRRLPGTGGGDGIAIIE